MTKITMVFSILLILLGIGGYFATDRASPTALIPAALGLILLGLGLLARKESLRPHAMHAAAALGLIGFLGAAPGIAKAFTLLGGGTVERPQVVPFQAIMAIFCAAFVVFCIRSFIQARRARTAQADKP